MALPKPQPQPKPEVESQPAAEVKSDEDFNFATDDMPETTSVQPVTQEEQSESNVSERRPRRRRRFNDETSTRRDRIPPEV